MWKMERNIKEAQRLRGLLTVHVFKISIQVPPMYYDTERRIEGGGKGRKRRVSFTI